MDGMSSLNSSVYFIWCKYSVENFQFNSFYHYLRSHSMKTESKHFFISPQIPLDLKIYVLH